MRRILLATSLFAIAQVAMTLCIPAAEAQTLRMALRQDPDILDPTLARCRDHRP